MALPSTHRLFWEKVIISDEWTRLERVHARVRVRACVCACEPLRACVRNVEGPSLDGISMFNSQG
jgi:hypothetical protein